MAAKRILLEVGTGNDWHGGDYTKAAARAVEDALHHCSLIFLRTLAVDPGEMRVDVTIGVQQPAKVDADVIRSLIPHGQVSVTAVSGGLDVANAGSDDISVIANAAITVHLDLDR
ncbi:MAG: Lin0512 family protein [Proteobacteria bacterium]|nr:Lin0512 family protein [Pseudomonadota bacterium]